MERLKERLNIAQRALESRRELADLEDPSQRGSFDGMESRRQRPWGINGDTPARGNLGESRVALSARSLVLQQR